MRVSPSSVGGIECLSRLRPLALVKQLFNGALVISHLHDGVQFAPCAIDLDEIQRILVQVELLGEVQIVYQLNLIVLKSHGALQVSSRLEQVVVDAKQLVDSLQVVAGQQNFEAVAQLLEVLDVNSEILLPVHVEQVSVDVLPLVGQLISNDLLFRGHLELLGFGDQHSLVGNWREVGLRNSLVKFLLFREVSLDAALLLFGSY